jgi:hypothetical protein
MVIRWRRANGHDNTLVSYRLLLRKRTPYQKSLSLPATYVIMHMASKSQPSLFDPHDTCHLTRNCYKSTITNVPSRFWIPDTSSCKEKQQKNKLSVTVIGVTALVRFVACMRRNAHEESGAFRAGRPMRMCHDIFSYKYVWTAAK